MTSLYKNKIKGSVILITGGTGSFGNAIIQTLFKLSPKKIIIFSRDEKKQHDMRNFYDNRLLKFIIGDVRDKESVDKVVEGIDYIFHAAALKQVPTCEFFPMEALKTNILGTYNIINASISHKVKRVVVLSTDKAVYPINVVGMTKAIAEKIVISESKSFVDKGKRSTVICSVRYGNVLYTRGSVLPYFVSLMKKNKKLPITSKYMTRFLLPLQHAVDLVLFALTKGESGYVYVRESPACTIETLTQALCQIFNYRGDTQEVGIRAGEKIHETLITREEIIRTVKENDYFKIPPEGQELEYNKYFISGRKVNIEGLEPYTSENTKRLNVKQTVALLRTLPEIKEELKKNSE